ncbi:30S ribosome-binding factor RbfA [Candidatus Riesia pediculicola]|uniref:Ribosome-binding factor A n=1 Tax=Riesia pediculicola (strain USDA) TaxID=515618 RepID=D4G864_RIEPU|nr:30S ribosome-binding factor RbfA [Candidatus Riesia pediculicola]ADD79909.1 ribosome-binding factor A [Candidatus Riesia pediculicola USDA]ARC53768.1 hypothetical protein AOE55_01205 [Candidatus Riesia pediculicola]QOJ86406.1 30S ribosome-binding factor RbfA [Candidatus Riesia pediculicola]
MKRSIYRSKKLSRMIQKELSWILHRHIMDPRMKKIMILHVDLRRDLSFAKVFFSIFFSYSKMISFSRKEKSSKEVVELLNDRQFLKMVRYLLAQKIEIRMIPKLTFFQDRSIEESIRIDHLIKLTTKNRVFS